MTNENSGKHQGGYIKKGSGSFWVSQKAINVLIESKATSLEICVYLILAKYTDQIGIFSTSGAKAVYKAMRVSQSLAKKTLCSLQNIKSQNEKLLYCPEEWMNTDKGKEFPIPERPTQRSQVRWVLNDFNADNGDKVWFSNDLIDGYGLFEMPLRRLKQCGDVACRLLLLLYCYNDMEAYGGISPHHAIYKEYEVEELFDMERGFCAFFAVDVGTRHVLQQVSWPSLGMLTPLSKKAKKEKRKEVLKPFWDAVRSLQQVGFIYEVVTVFDGKPGNKEALPIYFLHTHNRHGKTPKGEEGVAGRIANLMSKLGRPLTDEMGRFYGKYGVIVPEGITPHVIGMFRLRFRVNNPLSHTVRTSWSSIHKCQEEAAAWIGRVEDAYFPKKNITVQASLGHREANGYSDDGSSPDSLEYDPEDEDFVGTITGKIQ